MCPAAPQRLTFFLSSGLSFFITSWRASSSFFFSSADDVALIVVMKVNVCATTQPVRFGPRSLTATGLAAHLARRNIGVLPTRAVPLHHVGAQLAELRLHAQHGVMCEAGQTVQLGLGSPQRPLGSSSPRDHQRPFRTPYRTPFRAMRQLTRAARASAASAPSATASRRTEVGLRRYAAGADR